MADITIFGHKVNAWYLAGGAVGLGVLYYLYTRNQASSSSSTATSTDPVTGLPYSEDDQVDPTTGMTYLAEAQEYGSVSAAESAVAGGYYSDTGVGDSDVLDAGYPTSNVGLTDTTTSTSFSSNAQWAQAVTAGLTSLGYSATDVAAALGLYFADHPLGTAPDGVSYTSIVQAAVAEYGPPPQGTYSIISSPTTTSTTTTSEPQVPVPNTVGQPQEAAFAILSAAGLHATGTPTIKGKTLIVQSSNPKAGTNVTKGSTVALTSKVQS